MSKAPIEELRADCMPQCRGDQLRDVVGTGHLECARCGERYPKAETVPPPRPITEEEVE